MGSAPMRWLGDRSYAIYLVHYPMLIVTQTFWAPFDGGMATVWAVTVGFAAVVLLVSDLCYRALEMPARHAIKALWERHKQAAMPRVV